ncbi:hypothetical protein Q4567_10590 [Aliiglaciecola sp. 2_MG-2023]|uniref:hypothetical protein n=1 Tax=unclassified Aliiglaciecola TaxID=2593648 RepID=UPI0026E3B906|nr:MULTISPECIES: hypothetical protein [unclassified Aliiglaciecola]MDO6711170.1 hypothetical protein [Aliiglaciecola sp. 2_MG-2023]MDO6752084.1 hypothetical protein [Aliiglaciecola sp. 1_MG-2023]
MTDFAFIRLQRLIKRMLSFNQSRQDNKKQPRNKSNIFANKTAPRETGSKMAVNYNLLPSYVNECLSEIDLSKPPGLAGDICLDLERIEYRALPELRPIVALLTLSAIVSRNTTRNVKLNVYVIATALSASGKEAHQNYLKQALKELNLDESLHETPRSDCNGQINLETSSGTFL